MAVPEEQKGEEAEHIEHIKQIEQIPQIINNNEVDEDDFSTFFSGLQEQAVFESKLEGPSSGPSNDFMFEDENDEDFDKQLDSTKGLRGMMTAKKEEELKDDFFQI
jgi:hypothetical protein